MLVHTVSASSSPIPWERRKLRASSAPSLSNRRPARTHRILPLPAVRKAAAPCLREGPRAEVTDEKTHLTDPEILELTYITSLYDMHATMCRALRLEFDDRPELVAEVEIPAGVEVRDLSADLSGE
nr:hypothetical protein GCM10017611_33340 [Rhodococcus wratislaviensis]